jgi:hypothetical protein
MLLGRKRSLGLLGYRVGPLGSETRRRERTSPFAARQPSLCQHYAGSVSANACPHRQQVHACWFVPRVRSSAAGELVFGASVLIGARPLPA